MSDEHPGPNPYQPQPYQPQSHPPQPHGQQPPYGAGAGSWMPPPDHPQATTVLVLGILGIAACQVCAPFAWVIGNRVKREIETSGGRIAPSQPAQVGRILGIVGTILLAVYVVGFIAYLAFIAVVLGTSASG